MWVLILGKHQLLFHTHHLLNIFLPTLSSHFLPYLTTEERRAVKLTMWASIQFCKTLRKIINVVSILFVCVFNGDDDDDLALSPLSSALISGFVVRYKLLSTLLKSCLLLFCVYLLVLSSLQYNISLVPVPRDGIIDFLCVL